VSVEILSDPARAFVDDLQRRYGPRRDELLRLRAQRRDEIAATHRLDFLPDTRQIREMDWRVPPPAPGLVDRRVEITGPTERKMAINALNSGAKVWLADLEDANTPHWTNVIGGQVNLYDAVRRTISYDAPDGRRYELAGDDLPTIVMRPRGWHLPERHITVDGVPAVGALVDAGLYLFHNAVELVERGSGPYLYLPKLESHLEARLWNDIFDHVESALGLNPGTIRATVLIETIPAAFEMDEILWELRPHAAGLNAGRWDYLFSIIKKFRDAGPSFVLPDRAAVTMTAPFMRAYTEVLVATCHRRGAMAMGGMAAFIPSRRDPEVNATALAKVRADKEREAGDGFDGSWVAHPDLVEVCRDVFDATLGGRPNQIDRLRDDVRVTADQLLDIAATPGAVTEAGVRGNISVGVRYIASWLAGTGAAAIDNLMEDAATAEISRSQIWQWVHNGTTVESGDPVTADYVHRLLAEDSAIAGVEYTTARELFLRVALADDFVEFLTLPAYELID
jgi:malate synthase